MQRQRKKRRRRWNRKVKRKNQRRKMKSKKKKAKLLLTQKALKDHQAFLEQASKLSDQQFDKALPSFLRHSRRQQKGSWL